MMRFVCLASLAAVILSEAVAAYEQVCYGELGCFTNAPPWGNTPSRDISDLPESPEDVDTRFYLDTRMQEGLELHYDDVGSELEASTFDPSAITRIVVMGYVDGDDDKWMKDTSQALLASESQNVIRVNWKGARMDLRYEQSAVNAEVAGAALGILVSNVMSSNGLPPSAFHCVGHSLGAHVCAYLANRVPDLGRISGLDPAGAYFEGTEAVVRLDRSDAAFVDVIHTDTEDRKGYGTAQESGHVDFWPNGGTSQPGCEQNIVVDLVGTVVPGDFVECNHMMATYFYTESILDPCPYRSYPCDFYDDFVAGKCVQCGDTGCPRQGYFANETASLTSSSVNTYLQTADNSPYCEYMTYVSVTIGSDVKSIDGSLYATLVGTKGQTEKERLGVEHSLQAGAAYKELTYYATDPGDVTSVIFEWKQEEIELGRQTISVSEIAVWKGDVQTTFVFCGDQNLEMKEKQPYVFDTVCR